MKFNVKFDAKKMARMSAEECERYVVDSVSGGMIQSACNRSCFIGLVAGAALGVMWYPILKEGAVIIKEKIKEKRSEKETIDE